MIGLFQLKVLKLAKFESYIELFQLKVLKLAKLKLYWIVSAKNVEKEKMAKLSDNNWILSR